MAKLVSFDVKLKWEASERKSNLYGSCTRSFGRNQRATTAPTRLRASETANDDNDDNDHDDDNDNDNEDDKKIIKKPELTKVKNIKHSEAWENPPPNESRLMTQKTNN